MISVALCTYNGEKFIGQQLDSIFAQSMPVDEVVICDDCSKDSTCALLESYASRYSQIRLIKNEKNVGFRKNFENAIKECKGDFIFLSDQDDIWDRNKVEVLVTYLQESGMYGAYTDGRLISQGGEELNETLFSRLKFLPYVEHHLIEKYEFEITCLNGNHVTGATLAITKSAKDIILPFRTSKNYIHDMWIALKLSSIHKLGCINQPLISYRLHSDQECGMKEENIKDLFFNCYVNKSNCANFLEMRRRSIAPIYIFKLSFKERMRIFSLYKTLYIKNLPGKSKTKEISRFLLTEFVVHIKLLTGLRVAE